MKGIDPLTKAERRFQTMRTGKYVFLGVLALALLIGQTGFVSAAETVRGVTPDSIRIGVSAPLTKFLANAGRQSVAAINAYVTYINNQGGINGKKIVLVVDDSQLDPSISLGIFKKQITNDNIFAHISWGTPATGVLIKPATEEKMPLLVMGAAKSFYLPPKKYVFSFMAPYEIQAAACVTYIHDVLKKKNAKIAIFWRNDDYGKTALQGGRAAAAYYKYDVVAEPSYVLGQAIDFASEVLKIKRAKAEFVLLGASVGDVSGFLREAKTQGLNATIIGALSPASERKIINMAGDAAENYMAMFTSSMFRESQIPGVKKMLEVSQKYAPADILAEESYYYTLVYYPFELIVEALKRAGANPTTDGFIKGLESIRGDSVGEGLGPAPIFSPTVRYLSNSSFLGKVNMGTKDYDRVKDWFAPPQELINQIMK
jgi:branched-chain amino acid transport system substrate-binding protein